MVRIKKVLVAVVILASAALTSSICHAEGWGGGGNYNPGGPAGWSTQTGGTHATAWFHFDYVGGSSLRGKSITIDNQWNNGSKHPTISGLCAKEGVGFWILANGTNNSAGDYKEPGSGCYTTDYYEGTEAYKLWSGGFYRNETNCAAAGPDMNEGGNMFYRNINKGGTGFAPYDTLSTNNVTFSSDPDKGSIHYGLEVARQELFLGSGSDGKSMYINDKTASSPSQVMASYREYTRRDDNVTDIPEGTSDDATYAKMVEGNDDGSIFAFCSFEGSKSTKLESRSEIEVYQNNTKKSWKLSDWGKTETADEVELDDFSDITLKYHFAYQRGKDTTFATGTIANGSNVVVNREGLSAYVRADATTPGFVIGNRTLSTIHENYKHETEGGLTISIADLDSDTPYTYCASVTHPSEIKLSGTSTTGSGSAGSGACVVIKIKPVTADIDSDTRASLDGKNYDSGADASKTYPDNGYISVKAGPKTVTWSHYLGWTIRSDEKTGNVLAKTYGLNGAKTLDYALTVGKYNNSHTFNLNKNDDGYPSTSGNNNTSEAGVFPGEARDDISQSLKHPSKVNVTSGDAATGSSGESSSVTLRLKADNIQCGLDNDHLYPIGVDAPNDYRWLSIYRDNIAARPAASAIAGDGVADSDNLWITEDNKIYISQIACFGSQIGVDASNKGSDRFSRNLWAVDERESDVNRNRKFTLTSDFSDTYFMANSASGVSSHTNRSLRASEIGVTNFSNVSTPKSRITNNYKIEAKTGWTPVNGYLGRSFNTTFRKPNSAPVTVSVKIPYNYYLTVNPGGSETLDGASNASFAVTIKNNGRVNKQVCSGRNNGSNCAAYATRTKKTTANMVVFALDSDFDVSALSNHSDFTIQGNMSSVDNIKSVIGQRLGSYNPQSLKEAQNGFSNAVIGDSGTKTLKAEDIDYSDYPVGTKICAATAVYPSDSHDTGISTGENAYVIDSAEQSNALRENGQLTRYNVTCRTVAKHQTMSVEGNGLATAGNINTNSTIYKGRVFRSWSEYQIVSSSGNAGSGAVTAYALNNAVTDPYATKDNIDQYSVKSGSFLYPQSLGNIRQLTYLGSNSKDEATTNWGYAEKLKNTIIDKYGNPSDALPDEYYRSYSGGNIEITPQGYGKETIIIRTAGKAAITANSKLDDSNAWGNPKQIIIIANSIDIAGDVEKVNAWLIADGGEFNTCAGNQPDYKKPGTNEGDGNQHLLDNCNRPLFINGAVIVDGPVTLPRTYGGGSVVDAGGSITKDERTYALRAEIFNYDPRVVKWAYEESKKNPQLVTTYTESLAPRL